MSTAVDDTTTAADVSAATDTSTATDTASTTAADTSTVADTSTTAATPAAPAAPVVPETYDLTLPENAALDAGATERTAAFARERGLSNEAANAALHLANTEVAAAKAQLLQDHQPGGAAWTALVDGWKAETLKDATLGRTPEERTAAIQKGVGVLSKFAEADPTHAPQLTAFLNETGLGNHPAVVHLFRWLGEAAGEASLVTASVGGDGRKSDVDVFYKS